MLPVQSLFSTAVAKRVTHATPRNIQQWVTGGLITPTVVGKKKAGYKWSFRDLVELRTLVALRREHKMSFAHLCQIATFLQEQSVDWTLTSLVVFGNDILWLNQEQWMSLLKLPGQLTLLRYDLAEAERDVRTALYAA